MASPVAKGIEESAASQAAARALGKKPGEQAVRKSELSSSSAGAKTEKSLRERKLSVSDVAVLQRSLGGSDVALKAAGRIHAEVQLTRQGKQSSTLFGYVVSGVGSIFSAFGRIPFAFLSEEKRAERAKSLSKAQSAAREDAISKGLGEYKKAVENVIVQDVYAKTRQHQGKTFEKTADTPKSLLLVSVPTEKVGKVVDFGVLKKRIGGFCAVQGSRAAVLDDKGDARIVLTRNHNGKQETLEFSYRSPGRVDVYLNGVRQGKMWTDEALKVAQVFNKDMPFKFKKEERTSNSYTIV